jgi:hypothetical protein
VATCKNDDFDYPNILQSSVTFNATAGTTYKIAVDGYDAETGNIVLNWSVNNCSAPTGIQFEVPNYNVSESQYFMTVKVSRNNTSGAATVNYATSDTAGLQNCTVANGRGSERCDYVTCGRHAFICGRRVSQDL